MTVLWNTALLMWVPLSFVVAWRAQEFRRSPLAWLVLSRVFSPYVAAVFLVVADVPHKALIERQKEAFVRSRHPSRDDVQEVQRNDGNCSACNAVLNIKTGEGLYASKDEPWRLFCQRCDMEYVPFD